MILAVSDMHIGYEKFAHEMCWNNDKKGVCPFFSCF